MKKESFKLLPPGDAANHSKDGQIVYMECRRLFGFKDISLALNQNSNISILIAPNGFGKTTFLNLLNGIITFSDYSKRPAYYEKDYSGSGPMNKEVCSVLKKAAYIPFGIFSIVRYEEGQYRLCSLISSFYLLKRVSGARSIYSNSFYYVSDVLDPADLTCKQIDQLIALQKQRVENAAQEK